MNITAYAEKFSKPSRPILVFGAYVYFVSASAASITDQIADVGVHLYTSENGLPGKKLDSMWWRVFELETPSGSSLTATEFEFDPTVIDDEFFIVVDGIPEKNDSVDVSFAMADFRDHGLYVERWRVARREHLFPRRSESYFLYDYAFDRSFGYVAYAGRP